MRGRSRRAAKLLLQQSDRAVCLCVCPSLQILSPSPSAQPRCPREVTRSRDSVLVFLCARARTHTHTYTSRVPGLVLHFFTTNKLLQTLSDAVSQLFSHVFTIVPSHPVPPYSFLFILTLLPLPPDSTLILLPLPPHPPEHTHGRTERLRPARGSRI